MLGMKYHFDISDSIDICEVDIAGVACITLPNTYFTSKNKTYALKSTILCCYIVTLQYENILFFIFLFE